jgi:hypothetical protein
MFGDQKSIELYKAFRNIINNIGISLSKANAQCEEFDKALSTLVALSGNWHTSLNMGQSIVKFFTKCFLNQYITCLDGNKSMKNEYVLQSNDTLDQIGDQRVALILVPTVCCQNIIVISSTVFNI